MNFESLPRRTYNRIPRSTYRLQLRRGFGAREVTDLIPYLEQLGISDCYLSPMFQAVPGSAHGYDTCDFAQLNPELGSEAEHRSLADTLRQRDMGLLADFVPNHMSAAVGNPWWRDVLENGRCSPFASFFDIDWSPIKAELKDKILLPILADQYGAVLERGELRLRLREGGSLVLDYSDIALPIDPRQYATVLEHCTAPLRGESEAEDGGLREVLSVITAFRNLPASTECESERISERQREKEVARRRLGELVAGDPRLRAQIERGLAQINGTASRPQSFDLLHDILEAQPYRLSYWRTASHEINYRRFFDINQLAGLRMENPAVFTATHELLLKLIADGRVTGLRLDHVDGLFDPHAYLETLQAAIRERRMPAQAGEPGPLFYVVVEKVLSDGERLRDEWPVAGTTGYEFLEQLNGLFIDARQERQLARVYRRFSGVSDAYANLLYECKKLIMDGTMASELNVLAHALNRLSERDRRSRDLTLNSLRQALREVVACFPIYRTYVNESEIREIDRDVIELAIRRARRRNPTMDPSLFAFVREWLLPESKERSPNDSDGRFAFAMKFQQYTAPVEAKGREDTSFYRYNLLLSLNEVGGDPQHFGSSPPSFHAANEYRCGRGAQGLLATSTHDTKRSEDVRARLNVLSELPTEWGRQLSRWSRINAAHRGRIGDALAPDRDDEYVFYQSLLGIWPGGANAADDDLVARLTACITKAAREAKLRTSWLHPDDEYEAALARFARGVLQGPTAARFVAAFLPFQQRVAVLGMVNSLSQLVLKAVCPGVPDFYQGTEIWDFSLVDPDNRRTVDFATRRAWLAEIEPLLGAPAAVSGERRRALETMLLEWQDGRIKLFATASLLRLRRRFSEVFEMGQYQALAIEGAAEEHAVALLRHDGNEAIVAVVPRLLAGFAADEVTTPWRSAAWGDTRVILPAEFAGGSYESLFCGRRVEVERSSTGDALSVAGLFEACTVAVLIGSRRVPTSHG